MQTVEVGIVGKPNVGKSTFFSALTEVSVPIANYPFTTIEPNKGIAFVRVKCPHTDVSDHCNPRTGFCKNGIRYVPVEIIDVAGLVPGAHEGKGLGNKFLDDLRAATGFIQVIDLSGSTSLTGDLTTPGSFDPEDDVKFLGDELAFWIRDIIERGWRKASKTLMLEGKKIEDYLQTRLTGLGISRDEIIHALRESPVDRDNPDKWTDDEILSFSRKLREISKPMLIVGNKADISSDENIARMSSLHKDNFLPASSEFELTLKKAAKHNLISYEPGNGTFAVNSALNGNQKLALNKIDSYLKKYRTTGVQTALEKLIFDLLQYVVVFPVQDEGRYADGSGNILPDAVLVKKGSSARDIAYKIHTDLGDNFIRAVNAKTRMVIGQNYNVEMGDVIKIIARA